MSNFLNTTDEALCGLFEFVAAGAPRVGKRVKVTGGRKHRGKAGTVKRHQESKFGAGNRYGGSSMSGALSDATGKHGFCCLVEQDNGETFWVDARWCEVDQAGGEA